MDSDQAAEKLAEWALATCPDLNAAYEEDPESKTAPLPDVAVVITSEGVTDRDPSTAIQLEQLDLHVYRAKLLLMVEPDEGATDALQGFVKALGDSLKADQTLGGRIPAASPYWDANYDPPFFEFDDGTEGRIADFSLTIAEPT